MKKKVLVAAFAAMTLSATASADVSKGTNPWTQCGIGGMIFSDIPVAALISNIIWDLGTTAVTSATASPDTCKGAPLQTAQFIMENYDVLAEETARGEGDHLTAALSLAGCAASEQSAAASLIRTDVAGQIATEEFAAQDKVEKSTEYYNSLQQAASASCEGALI